MWNRHDVSVIATAAVATFGLTLASFWPQIATAVDDQPLATTDVKIPTLNLGSARVTSALDALHPNTVILTLRNTADEATTAQFDAQADVVGPSSKFSRVGPPSRIAWTREFSVQLEPGETRTISVELPAEAFGIANPQDAVRQTLTGAVPGGSYLTLVSADARQPMAIRALSLSDGAALRPLAADPIAP